MWRQPCISPKERSCTIFHPNGIWLTLSWKCAFSRLPSSLRKWITWKGEDGTNFSGPTKPDWTGNRQLSWKTGRATDWCITCSSYPPPTNTWTNFRKCITNFLPRNRYFFQCGRCHSQAVCGRHTGVQPAIVRKFHRKNLWSTAFSNTITASLRLKPHFSNVNGTFALHLNTFFFLLLFGKVYLCE